MLYGQRRFYSKHLLSGAPVSEAETKVMSVLGSWLSESHDLSGCARARSYLNQPRCATTWPDRKNCRSVIVIIVDPSGVPIVTTAQSLMWCLMQVYKEWASLLLIIILYRLRMYFSSMWGSLRLSPIIFYAFTHSKIEAVYFSTVLLVMKIHAGAY